MIQKEKETKLLYSLNPNLNHKGSSQIESLFTICSELYFFFNISREVVMDNVKIQPHCDAIL